MSDGTLESDRKEIFYINACYDETPKKNYDKTIEDKHEMVAQDNNHTEAASLVSLLRRELKLFF